MNKLLCSINIVLFCFCFTACSIETNLPKSGENNDVDTSGDYVICLDEDMLALAGMSADEMVNFLETDWGSETYDTAIAENDDVNIYYDAEQKSKIEGLIEQRFEEFGQKFGEYGDKYSMEVSDDKSSIDVYCNIGVTEEELTVSVENDLFYIYIYDLLQGIDYKNLSIPINVYNCDTGNLCVTSNSKDGTTISADDWEKSYDDDTLLITVKKGRWGYYGLEASFWEEYLSTFGDCFVTEEYLESSESFVFAVKDMDAFNETMAKKVEELSKDFAGRGENYKLTVSEDYSKIQFHYDDQLDKELILTIEDTAVFDTMLYSYLNSPYEDNWSCQVEIYNSSTGELKKTYNYPDESIGFLCEDGMN